MWPRVSKVEEIKARRGCSQLMHGNIVEGVAALIRIQGVEGVLIVGERGVQGDGCIKRLRSQ